MEEQKSQNQQQPAGGQKKSPLHIIAATMVCVLIVLIISNLQALIRPFQILNSVLTPITIGLVVAYLANPLLRLFEFKVFFRLKSRRLNRSFSLLCTYLVILLMIAGSVWLIVPQIIDSVNDLRVNGMIYIDNIIASINALIRAIPFLEENPDNLISFEKLLNFALEWLNDYSSTLIGGVGSFASGMLTVLKNILVGFFVSLYVLLSKNRLNAGCRRVIHALLPEKKETLLLYYIRKAHRKFGGFFIGKIIDSIIIGLISGVVFQIFQIPYAILVAVIIGVTNVIPFFGPFIGAIPSGIIIFIKDPMKALIFCLLILIIQQFDGNILGPLILGGSTGLSSLGILVAITVSSGLLGFGGMLIGVPLFALLMAMLDDYVIYKLHKKGHSVRLRDYYPADAFIKPDDLETEPQSTRQRFLRWIMTVETEKEGVDYAPSIHHSVGRGIRIALLRIGRYFRRLPLGPRQKKETQPESAVEPVSSQETMPPEEELNMQILPPEPEPLMPIELFEEHATGSAGAGSGEAGVLPGGDEPGNPVISDDTGNSSESRKE